MSTFSRRRFNALTVATLTSLLGRQAAGLLQRSSIAGGDELVSLINPMVGASTSAKLGEGKTFPGATTPFGLVQLSPDTVTGGDNAPGYSYENPTMEGFSFTHLSGVGAFGDLGNLQVMPTTGPMKFARGRSDQTRYASEGWRSRFNHATEKATANYYAVDLDDYKIRTELTAAPKAGILRFTFPESETSRIQIDLSRRIAGSSTRQQVKVVDKNAIEGWMLCPATAGGWRNGGVGYTVFFRMEFSKPLMKFGIWSIDVPESAYHGFKPLVSAYFNTDDYYQRVANAKVIESATEQEGNHLGFFTEFASREGDQVLVKAGISFVSVQGARHNLAIDIPAWDFDGTQRRGRQQWADTLANVQVSGGTNEQRAIFATALYHASIDPRIVSDHDGSFVGGDNQIHKTDFYKRRTVFSGWDVFRADFPLMTITNPAMIVDEINSLVNLAQESGKGYLERWELLNAYTGVMDGDPATAVIVDAQQKGLHGFDYEKAYAAVRQTAMGTGANTNRKANDFYLEHGYVPDQVTWTLDGAYYDWCAGKMAASLGKTADSREFMQRAQNYKKIYDPTVISMRARDATGAFMPWEGLYRGSQGCIEANPGQQRFFVTHDVQGLIDLMGRDVFVKQLEEMFENTPPDFKANAYYNHGNEPVHHVAYLFVYAGKPWLTQKWVRRILDNAYHNRVDGICGNDDVGQMSAWFVISSMGLYQVCPGDNTYILGTPLFPEVSIGLDQKFFAGKTFRILAHGVSSENFYVQSVTLNRKRLERAWITHQEIVSGGILEFTMGPAPNMQWASSAANLPPSMTKAKP
jgi:predicted alpha-1,2-mannosidase